MHLNIKENKLAGGFLVTDTGKKIQLKKGGAKPITIDNLFILNKEIARLAAMLLDGSLAKNLSSITFSQKKDITKAGEFASIIKKRFGVNSRVYNRNGTVCIACSNRTLCYFLWHVLDFYKSDEPTKIPKWIWTASKDVKIEYLRYAFAMEGSIKDPDMGISEIKFHSCDPVHVLELQRFLKSEFSIHFKIKKYYIHNYGFKYYLYISRDEEIKRFAGIGFALESHQNRLDKALKRQKGKAWEITLATILNKRLDSFNRIEIQQFFPYLRCSRSLHQRLSDLVRKKFLTFNKTNGKYSLTEEGNKMGSILKNTSNVPLRTRAGENEQRVLAFVKKNGVCWRNELAKALSINACTVRDTLKRLEKQGKVEYIGSDKFQRRLFKIKKSGKK